MCPINNTFLFTQINPLKPGRPADQTKRIIDCLIGYSVISIMQQLCRHNSQSAVFYLVFAPQMQGIRFLDHAQQMGGKLQALIVFRTADKLCRKIFTGHKQVSVLFLGRLADNFQWFALGGRHHRHIFLDNPGLMPGHPGQRTAAAVSMFQGDIGDNGNFRHNDIRGIQKSAQTYFNDSIFHMLDGKVEKSQRCQYFKLGRTFLTVRYHLVNVNLDRTQTVGKFLLTDGLPVHPYPLRIGNEMRRTVKACVNPRMAQDACQHGRHRTLAIGASHMNGTIPLLRQLQTCQQFLHAFQTKFDTKNIKTF